MFGTGLLKGLGVTFKRFADTYIDDVKHIPSRYAYGHDCHPADARRKGHLHNSVSRREAASCPNASATSRC